jgi:hypothetical protein
MILEKTEVLFCYGKCPVLIIIKSPIVKPVLSNRLKSVLSEDSF